MPHSSSVVSRTAGFVRRSRASAAPAGGPSSTLAELEKQHIFRVLEECDGNRTHAAKVLDISIRTLRNKLNEYQGKGKDDGADLPEEAVES